MIFERMLRLNPSVNQGVRFFIDDVREILTRHWMIYYSDFELHAEEKQQSP